ncbi:MAG: hypothetical protein V3U75_13660 [Methylococcaceae bacterium]
MKTKYLIANIAILMTVSGISFAEKLSTMEGIPAEVMSHEDLLSVEGKSDPYRIYANQHGSYIGNRPNPFSTTIGPINNTKTGDYEYWRSTQPPKLLATADAQKPPTYIPNTLNFNSGNARSLATNLTSGFSLSPNAGFNPTTFSPGGYARFPVQNFSQPNPGNSLILGLVNPSANSLFNMQTQIFGGFR